MRLLSESTKKLFIFPLNVDWKPKFRRGSISITIEIAVESFYSESVREIQFVLIDVDLKVALDENWGVIVDINQFQSKLHRIPSRR